MYTNKLLLSDVFGSIHSENSSSVHLVEHSTLTLRCSSSTDDQIRWHYIAPDSKTDTVIYNGERLNKALGDRYSVKVSEFDRSSQLTVCDVQCEDAGVWKCFEMQSIANSLSFVVIVFAATGNHQYLKTVN